MADHKKNYTKSGRNKREKYKQRARTKNGRIITKEYLDYIDRVNEKDKATGITKSNMYYNGNRLCVVNRFLCNSQLMPAERICYKYKASPIRAKGKLRDNRIIEVRCKELNKRYRLYTLLIDDIIVLETKMQYNVVSKIKKIIGY